MTLSDLSIKRPVFAWMLMLGLILFGGISFSRMGVSQLPDVDFPVVSVSVAYEGAAPEVMETEVVDPIEDAVMGVQGVRSVSSSSRSGSASVSVEFELNRDIDVALQEVQTKIAQAQRRLPKDIDPPIVTKTNPEDQPIIWLAVESENWQPKDLMAYVRDHMKDRFTSVSGVGEVFLGGYVDPNLRVWASAKKLKNYALTISDLKNAILFEHSELPAGKIETPSKEFNVRAMGEAQSVKEFENIRVNQRGGQPNYTDIRVKQVARVEEGLDEVRRLSRAGGKPAVGLGIRKQRGSNAVEVARLVKKRMAEVNKVLPPGVSMNVNFDSTKFIEESVSEINFTLLLSAALTALVCWAFLGTWSSTFNILLAIPTSIIGSFIFLYFAGFTLNTFTLLGLSLAMGIVVDDAIMVLENIVRHVEEGKDKVAAAVIGAREITFAALAATIAIVAIFLPVAFMKGIIGKFFFQFGVTMTVAVMLSLFEALTLTPMRCSQMMTTVGDRITPLGRWIERTFDWMREKYFETLKVALNYRWSVVIFSLLFFAASFFIVKLLNKEFTPAQDQSIFMVRFTTPVGSSLNFTSLKIKEVEQFLNTLPEVKRYFFSIGGFGGGEVNTAHGFVTLVQPHERKKTQQQLMGMIRSQVNKIQELKGFVQDISLRGFTASRGFPVEFTVRGPDWEQLAGYSQEIMKAMEKADYFSDIDTDYLVGMPEVRIIPDRDKAAERGVSIQSITETVNAMIGGIRVSKYPKADRRIDVRIRLEESERGKTEDIKSLFVRNNRGELIQLADLVRIEQKPSLQIVSRKDRERAVSVFSNVKTGKSQALALSEVETIAKKILPEGYRIVFSGSAETFKESFQSLIFALILGLLVSYMVLASQFNSYIDPVTVLMALPFSVSGAFIALYLGNQSLNIYSMIGLILLMGIVKKNSILLVDFTNQVLDTKKVKVREALLEACPIRLRPILMTSLSTIAGAIPPALALGPGAESRIPMAIAVIGGVLVSSLLTLYVVPCVYSLFSVLQKRTVIHIDE